MTTVRLTGTLRDAYALRGSLSQVISKELAERISTISQALRDYPRPRSNGAQLLILTNGDGVWYSLEGAETWMIGSHDECDIELDCVGVSRKHCQLEKQSGVWELQDLGSKNGTHLNRKRVESAYVVNGDALYVGDLVLLFFDELCASMTDREEGAEI